MTVIGSLFEEIGISWRCQDSQGVLEVRAAAVAKRLGVARKGLTRMHTKKYDSDESSDESIEVHIAEFDASPRIRL